MAKVLTKHSSHRVRQIPITSNRAFEENHIRRLVAAGVRTWTLGIAVLDSQTRFESVNEALSQETRASIENHLGKTSSEIVGGLAAQIEPTYENVLRTGRAESLVLAGHVRETPEFGYWLDHCFPIFDQSGRVQHLGLFVVNVTAENAAREIVDALAFDPKLLKAGNAGILGQFDEAVRIFHDSLENSFKELANPSTEAARRTDHFRSSIRDLDEQISKMRELIYLFISQFSVPRS